MEFIKLYKPQLKKAFLVLLLAIFTVFGSTDLLYARAKSTTRHSHTQVKRSRCKTKKKNNKNKKSRGSRKNRRARRHRARRGSARYVSASETAAQKKQIAQTRIKLMAHPDMSGEVPSLPAESYVWPIRYGYIARGVTRWHRGVDMMSRPGQPVYAVADGVVTFVAVNNARYRGHGKFCIVSHKAKGTTSLYSHCSAIYVAPGQTVKRGQKIAAVGRTGLTTTNHLHFEMTQNGRRINPLRLLPKTGALGRKYVPH